MSIEYRELPESSYVELRVDGGVSRAELEDFIDRFDRFAEGKRVGPPERGTFWKAMRFRLKNVRRLARLGVVTDSRRLSLLLAIVDRFTPAEIRTFRRADEDRARRWVTGEGASAPVRS